MASEVRPYTPADRAAVVEIAADTAFFGAPVEAFLDDRRLQQDFFVAYYVDREPEHLWVAMLNGEVVGYICGSTGGRDAARGQAATAAAALARLVTFRYRVGRLTVRYATRAALAAARGEYPHVPLDAYPAHLHINLAERARGAGLGKRLMVACLDQMAALGVPGIHLKTTSMNAAATVLYDRMGFELLARRPTRLWAPWLPDTPVENLVYGKRFS